MKHYIELNAKFAKDWPSIEEGKDPLDSAEEYKDKKGKGDELSPNAAS
jgi:hypothetical protein